MVQLEIRNTISSELISISVLYNEPIQQLRVTVCARFGGLSPADLVLISNGVKYENKRKLSDYVKGHHTEPISVFAISVPGEGNVMSEPTQPAVDNSPKTLSVFRDYSRLLAPSTATVVPVTHRVTSLDIEQEPEVSEYRPNRLWDLCNLTSLILWFYFAHLCLKGANSNDLLITSSDGWTLDISDSFCVEHQTDYGTVTYSCDLAFSNAFGQQYYWSTFQCAYIDECLNMYGFTEDWEFDSSASSTSTYITSLEFTLWHKSDFANGKLWPTYEDALYHVGLGWDILGTTMMVLGGAVTCFCCFWYYIL